MEVKVLKERLEEALAELNRTAPTRSNLPICSNVLLETEAGRLTATATDLEVAVKAYIGAQIEVDGACTVPAGMLAKMLKRIKADEALTIKGDEKATTFEMEGRAFTLEGSDPQDFPSTPSEFDKHGECEGSTLKGLLKRTVFCASKDDDRPVLHAVNMRAEGGTLTLAAADGFRLATFTMPYTGVEFEANVPLSVVAALMRLLPDDTIEIDVSDKAIRFTLGNYDVTGRIVQGSYPNYGGLIPDGYDHAITVQRDDLQHEVETAMVLASEGAGIIRLYASGETLRIEGKDEGTGDYTATIPAQVTGESGKVALNGGYILDILKVMEPGPVQLDWESGKPVRFTQGDAGLYIVMPMNVIW